jgi:HAE1 family hydrophobic/amphiphilic exporter-1
MKEQNRNSLTELENMSIPTATGGIIKLKEVAKIEEHWSPQDIERKNRQRVVKVSSLPYKISLGELAEDIDGVVKNIDIPDNINIRLGGTYEDQQETFGDIILLGLMIVLLVYIVMASQFESYSKPFIIMMAIPFAFTGVILSLLITGTTLDMIGALGIIMLVGIVVKNGIVLVDYINLMRDRGYELNEAIALSGKSRLRPVLMTAFTTILGMVPMTLSQGTGSEMWRPMGIVIIGGILASTLVTLIVVPILYSVMSRRGERDKEKGQRSKYVFMQLADNDEQE